MHIHIIAIGKLKSSSPEQQIIDTYLKQCGWKVSVTQLEEKRKLPTPQLQEAESNLILNHIPQGAKIIVLDEKGEQWTSRQCADTLSKWQDSGVSDVCFCIGGANGHSDILRKKAHALLSFGRMTLPHFLMRSVLSEQIYRAYTIINHHPYHRD